MKGSAALRALVGRLSLLAFGLVVGVLALEGLLQVGAVYVRATRAHPSIGAPTGGRRVVALGDSNTYGLYLAHDQAYPQQLEHLWNESHRQHVEVLNMGYPG